MRAVQMRIVLIVGLLLLMAGLCAAGWWAQGQLAARVAQTGKTQIDAELSQFDLEKLRHLETQLQLQEDVVERADQIAATAQNYQYQDQVVKDLEAYAVRHGVGIASFDFVSTQSGKPETGPAGTTRTPFSITLKGPLEFDRFMRFLRDIENNLTKLQVTSLSLTPAEDNPKMVSNPSLTLVVYLKK